MASVEAPAGSGGAGEGRARPAALALPGEIVAALARIGPLDAAAMHRAEARQRSLTKPPGSLGRLEGVAVRLAGILGDPRPRIRGKAVIVAAADHGVVAQGVTGYPQAVTAQMVANFLAGGAAVSVLCRRLGVRQLVVDAGIAGPPLAPHPDLRVVRAGAGTGDISVGPAMSRAQAEQCIAAGVALAGEVAADGADLIAAGDMGIGNTTAASAVTAAVTGRPSAETTGRGTGRSDDQLRRKIAVVERALACNAPDRGDALDVLAKVGGFEIGVLAGVMLGAAAQRRAVVLDGFIAGAAALLADLMCSRVRDYLFSGHRSAEAGHRALLDHLGLQPLLDLDLRLGEGSGALLAMPIIEAAAACLAEMATFAEAGVAERGAP